MATKTAILLLFLRRSSSTSIKGLPLPLTAKRLEEKEDSKQRRKGRDLSDSTRKRRGQERRERKEKMNREGEEE
ncbi:hypothetical protein CSUI_004389, partial [Cystoisospora suis]